MIKQYMGTAKKPSKPHRTVKPSEIPTKVDIQKRKNRIKKLEALGIEVNILDNKDNIKGQEDLDKLKASILIMQDKELPFELKERILKQRETVIKQ